MALQASPLREAVLEQPGEQGLVFGKSHHAAADIAGWQDVEFAAQASGAAAVICNRDDGGDFDLAGLQGIPLQAMEKSGKSGTSSNGDNAKRCNRGWLNIGSQV